MKKEPLIHITRNLTVSTKKKWIIRLIAIALGFILCSLVASFLGSDPITFFDKLIKGCFVDLKKGGFSKTKVFDLLERTAILLLIAVALTPAFKMKFWNIGAEGQIYAGVLVGAIMQKFVGTSMPTFLFFIVTIILCVLAGAIWGVIPAIFKAYFKTNETLFTLMMNYIMICIVSVLISKWDPIKASVPIFDSSLYLNSFCKNIPNLFNLLIVIVVCVAMWFYMTYTKHGYEIAVVGGSENTARYVGISNKWIMIRTMLLSGGLCGLVGFLLICGEKSALCTTITQNRGFTGVMVSWLGNLNVPEMGLYSFLVSIVTKGSRSVSNAESFPNIMTAIFVFTLIACDFFANYKINFRKKAHKEMKEVTE